MSTLSTALLGGRGCRLLLSQVFVSLSQAPETSGVGFSFPTCWAFQRSLLWWLDTQVVLVVAPQWLVMGPAATHLGKSLPAPTGSTGRL